MAKNCSVDGCEGVAIARGWCSKHWHRWRRTGDPLGDKPVQALSEDQVCSVEGCSSAWIARGLCNKHYLRWKNHGDPLGGKPGPAVHRVVDHEDGTRTCTVCALQLPITAFDVDRSATGGRRSHCKACRSARMKAWYEANQPRQLTRHQERKAQNRDRVRQQDTERYYRHREKRIDLATQSVHARRQRQRSANWVRGISVRSLRKRDGDLCCYCGITMTFTTISRASGAQYIPTKATIEHVIPLSRNGDHSWENTKLCCWQCNIRKNATDADSWIAACRAGEESDLTELIPPPINGTESDEVLLSEPGTDEA